MKRLTLFMAVFLLVLAFAWLWASLYVLQPNRINASVIALGWIAATFGSYTYWDEYKKQKHGR